MLFQRGGTIYIIPKDDNERYKWYISRGWYVVKEDSDKTIEFKKILQKSRMWINEVKLGCKYPHTCN
jgi:hypothetical protein